MKTIKINPHEFVILLLGFCLLFSCSDEQPSLSFFDLLEKETIPELHLETNMKRLLATSGHEDYESSKAIVYLSGERRYTFEVGLKTRGMSRREICELPPLKIKLHPKDLRAMGLRQDYSQYKLVTHCQNDADANQVLFKEYLAYKMYQLLTPRSFKVQLLRVRYLDIDADTDVDIDADTIDGESTHYAFLIESTSEMTDRLQAQRLEKDTETLKQINAEQYRIFVLFQYMIGNTDWNLAKQHNIKMITIADMPGPIPVPYDFDFSGLVYAPYARPYPGLGIIDVRERIFQFRGSKDADFSAPIALFKNKKTALYRICNDFELLNPKNKTEMLAYLESFYAGIDSMANLKEGA